MAPRERYLLQTTVDIPPEKDKEFNEWYNQVHVPDIIKCPGFLSARRLRSVQGPGPRYIAIYEIEHERVLETPEFNKARGWYQFTAFVIDPKATIYQEIFYAEP